MVNSSLYWASETSVSLGEANWARMILGEQATDDEQTTEVTV